ncbi:ATP-grasp fold amidoligase family protein [uncultured Prevotella sp.]|uniref:ATP-grasp fold amidoligase family protein n=1 Tax=uncultured Prevotella sp. TaxID=159272 RepID=UPI00258402F4|nr:ATP-grasp fold amidoligase family protein [uncultured Prevotella sp.]
MISRLLKGLKQPRVAICHLITVSNCFNWLSDENYLKMLWRIKFKHKLNLNSPKTYNEKLQWLKLYNRQPEYKKMVDKYAVKQYVAGMIGSEHIVPTLGVWDSINEIDWDGLPNQFVIKTTNGGGGWGVVVCKDKSNFDRKKAIKILKKSLKQDIYKSFREWPYKDMKKRILAEKYLEEPTFSSLRDFKVMCFDGKVKLIEYHEGRYTDNHTQDFYDCNWKKTTITQGSYGAFSPYNADRPSCLEEMIELSEKLANGIPHIRVDWYYVDSRLYFGELTFFDGSGMCPWDKYEDDLLMGSWITLPPK